MAENEPTTTAGNPQQVQIPLRIVERDVNASYANGFRTQTMTDEVLIDFGINQIVPSAANQQQPEILFQINQRVIMNYYSAKRLAMTLSQLIRRHEEQFGELELDPNKRHKK